MKLEAHRLQGFSDAVFAVIITIMVLELELPHGPALHDLQPLIPIFFAYVLSFHSIGSYWNNHHFLFHGTKRINIKIMWANLHFLFWLSLLPFFTAWLGKNYTESWPTALYGVELLATGIVYSRLQKKIEKLNGKYEKKSKDDLKIKLTLATHMSAILIAFVAPLVSSLLYGLLAIVWYIPSSKEEK